MLHSLIVEPSLSAAQEVAMNRETLLGQWKQVKGDVKARWGKLTDDDLTVAEGNFDKLVGRIQERYGYAREEAERQLDDFLTSRVG
jgi:uncharacterized protein YjbJ (UPF0337 family)